ncbi:MAG: hypothetical protein [Circular genetic element sp.]|nr:MAG: hypothetical protein [Circular genetic element sp.]
MRDTDIAKTKAFFILVSPSTVKNKEGTVQARIRACTRAHYARACVCTRPDRRENWRSDALRRYRPGLSPYRIAMELRRLKGLRS